MLLNRQDAKGAEQNQGIADQIVIPGEAKRGSGIQVSAVSGCLDSGLRRNDGKGIGRLTIVATLQSRAGRPPGKTVGGRDAAVEPPWMDSRRVLPGGLPARLPAEGCLDYLETLDECPGALGVLAVQLHQI